MISELRQKQLIWFANEHWVDNESISTQFATLDNTLGGGIPAQGLIELQSQLGVGELSLLSHYLIAKQEQGMIVFVSPPTLINSEALIQQGIALDKVLFITTVSHEETNWAVEQCLKSGLCSTVLAWPHALNLTQIRRLNLAAEQNSASLILYTPSNTKPLSNIKLSLKLSPIPTGIKIKIQKYRGQLSKTDPIVDLRTDWQSLYRYQSANSNLKTSYFAS